MRLMSFMLTTAQILDRSKTVTRRLGWEELAPGTRLKAVEKAMGLKNGERVNVLAEIEVVSVTQERLSLISAEDCAREGFPDLTPAQFVAMFCEHMRCKPTRRVNRIEFRYVD